MNELGKEYICVHKDHLLFVDDLAESHFKERNHILRLAIVIAISLDPDKKINKKIKSELSRNKGARNFQSVQIDKDQKITLLIKSLANSKDDLPYSRMEELIYIGLESLKKKYHSDDGIDWDSLQKAVQNK